MLWFVHADVIFILKQEPGRHSVKEYSFMAVCAANETVVDRRLI